MPKKPPADHPKATTTITRRPVIVPASSTAVYYVNLLEVSFTPHDFSISAVRTPSKITEAQLAQGKATGTLDLDAEAQFGYSP
jgi:hypothetical protein